MVRLMQRGKNAEAFFKSAAADVTRRILHAWPCRDLSASSPAFTLFRRGEPRRLRVLEFTDHARSGFFMVFFFACCCAAEAHIGSPNVFFEGRAGEYPVRVVIRPPQVVPGLAEITVRVPGELVHRVTVLPVFGKAGREGSPPPDEGKLVRGETNLYSAAL